MQTSFNSGEWSPRMFGRSDIDRYDSGNETFKNFIPLIQGPAMKRQGTRYIDEVKDSSEQCRLVEFEFSDEQAYVLLFGPTYIRIYLNEGRLDSGGSPVEVVTPYLEAELFELSVEAQSADVLYIAHPNHAPRKLSRTSATTWTLTAIDFFDGPYEEENTDASLNLLVSASSPPWGVGVTITLTAPSPMFDSNRDVDRHIRLKVFQTAANDFKWGSAIISAVNSTTEAEAVVERFIDADNVAETGVRWRWGSWYGGTTPNYPAVVSFHDQRLVFAADPNHPQTFYGSVTGDFESFVPTGRVDRNESIYEPGTDETGDTVNDDNAYQYTIASNEVNPIRWLASTRSLLIGTASGVFSAQASRNQEVITPSNISVPRALTKGASSAAPAGIEQSIFYLSSSQRKLFFVGFSLERDTFVPEDMGLLSEHLLRSGALELVFQNEPDPIAWMVTTDGTLVGLAFNALQEVQGWHRHILGGSFGGGQAVVESLAVIPATAGAVSTGAVDNPNHDQLWLLVKRTINGATKRYIEILEEPFEDGSTIEDAFFVDCGLSRDGAPSTTFSGLDHLEGETVAVLADGSKHPDRTVSGGAITLDEEASRVHVGLPYESLIRSLPLEGGSKRVSTRGKERRVNHAALLLDRSLGGEIATDLAGTTFEPLIFNKGSDVYGSPPDLYTGELTHDVDLGWSSRCQLTVRHQDPYPFTLLAWVADAHFSESGLSE